MKKILKNKYILGIGTATFILSAIGVGTSFADSNHMWMWKDKPAAVGTVTAINGNIITLTAKNGTVYTVDASNASVTKITKSATGTKPTSAAISVGQITIGDTLMVTGTISSANITATKIIDGAFAWRHKENPQNENRLGFKPAAAGKVTAINGNVITLSGRDFTTKSNTTYTVDAANATITKLNPPISNGSKPTSTPISVSQIAVGDMLIVQGTVSGTTIQATTIRDRQLPVNATEFSHRGFWHRGNPAAQPAQ
ncbi:hypothetical protein KGQ24_03525 [Patescibacteria group bacterium]|nr:hypothetical protein [Patescibacteria group bacterium]